MIDSFSSLDELAAKIRAIQEDIIRGPSVYAPKRDFFGDPDLGPCEVCEEPATFGVIDANEGAATAGGWRTVAAANRHFFCEIHKREPLLTSLREG